MSVCLSVRLSVCPFFLQRTAAHGQQKNTGKFFFKTGQLTRPHTVSTITDLYERARPTLLYRQQRAESIVMTEMTDDK